MVSPGSSTIPRLMMLSLYPSSKIFLRQLLKEFEKRIAYFVDDVNKIKYFKDLNTNF